MLQFKKQVCRHSTSTNCWTMRRRSTICSSMYLSRERADIVKVSCCTQTPWETQEDREKGLQMLVNSSILVSLPVKNFKAELLQESILTFLNHRLMHLSCGQQRFWPHHPRDQGTTYTEGLFFRETTSWYKSLGSCTNTSANTRWGKTI